LQRRYVNTRWALRRLLADYLDCEPQAVRFRYSPRGKPAVAYPADGGLTFSVAHSSELALIACTTQADIGVDVEQVREHPFWLDVARRYFSQKELALVEAQPPGERSRCFLQIWTFKEAYGKALGEGVGAALHRVRSFTGANGKLFAIAHDRGETMAQAPRIESLAPADGYVAAYSMIGMPVAAWVRVLDAAA
jgi:4'-phosphopantetheinyl transferase